MWDSVYRVQSSPAPGLVSIRIRAISADNQYAGTGGSSHRRAQTLYIVPDKPVLVLTAFNLNNIDGKLFICVL